MIHRRRKDGPDRPDGSPQEARPLTLERVEARLAALGHHVAKDDDGDLAGLWGRDRFWFLRMGTREEILQIRGRWHRTLPAEQRSALRRALNDWNRDRIWPKAYLRSENGEAAIYAEVSVDLAEGVTDEQIDAVISQGLASAGMLFASLGDQMPHSCPP